MLCLVRQSAGPGNRAIDPKFLSTAFSSAYTKAAITRFNAGTMLPPAQRFAVLYFADNPVVSTFEVRAVLGNPFLIPAGVPNPFHSSYVMLTVSVTLSDVVDVTDATAQTPLGTTAQELTGDWYANQFRGPWTPITAPSGISPTQELGRAFYRAGVEGFRAISATFPTHKTLIVFPDKPEDRQLAPHQ